MAEKNINKDQDTKKTDKTPFGITKGNGKNSKPKFNFYWIYGILAVVLLGVQFLNTGEGGKKPTGVISNLCLNKVI